MPRTDQSGTTKTSFKIGLLRFIASALAGEYSLSFPPTLPSRKQTLQFDETGVGSWGDTAQVITQAGHGFSVGDPVRVFNGVWGLATANSQDNLADGVVVAVPDANSFQVERYYPTLNVPSHGLGAANAVLYLSQTTAGNYVTIQPSSGIVQQIGSVVDANHIIVGIGDAFDYTNYQIELTRPPKIMRIDSTWVSQQEFNGDRNPALLDVFDSRGNGDAGTGELHFGPFVTRNWLRFWIGGAGGATNNPSAKYVELRHLDTDAVLWTETLTNLIGGVNNADLYHTKIDTSTHWETPAYLAIIDNDANGVWGFIRFKARILIED